MHIGFEAKRFFTNFTGLGNYARFVVGALSEFAPSHQYTLYSPKVVQHREVDPIVSRPNVRVVAPHGLYTLAKGLWRSWGVAGDPSMGALNVYHGLSQELPIGLPAAVKSVVTVHDLIYLRYPKFYNPIDVAIYKAKAVSACRKADTVIAISEQTADDLVEFLNIDRKKIKVVYQGCHPIFKRVATAEEKAAVKARHALPANFILTVGTLEPRKNVKALVQALATLPASSRLPLVMVGRATAYKQEIVQEAKARGIADELLFLHNASFADFPALYQSATAFVYPSLFEGFGIPLVEAIESRVPVITSTGSCFREAAGPAALYADPQQPGSLAQHIAQVLADDALRQRMITESLAYIARFEPPVIARDLLAVYAL